MGSTSPKSQSSVGSAGKGDRFHELQRYRKKKPRFLQQNVHEIGALKKVWKQPRGNQSKMRMKHRGKPKMPGIGYGSPNAIKGMTADGRIPFLIRSLNDFNALLHAQHREALAPILSGSLGMKSKAVIVKEALSKGISFVNLKDGTAYLTLVKKKMEDRKVQSTEARVKAEAAKIAAVKAKDAEKKEKVESAEEKKEREEQEMRKVLEGKHAA